MWKKYCITQDEMPHLVWEDVVLFFELILHQEKPTWDHSPATRSLSSLRYDHAWYNLSSTLEFCGLVYEEKKGKKCYYKALLTETMKPSHQLLQASSLCSLHDWFVSKDMWKETLSAPLSLPDQGCYWAQWRKGKAVNSMQRHTLDRQTVSETVTRKLSHANWWAIK